MPMTLPRAATAAVVVALLATGCGSSLDRSEIERAAGVGPGGQAGTGGQAIGTGGTTGGTTGALTSTSGSGTGGAAQTGTTGAGT
ncbi:MAG: hypothetical protein QOE84_2150, partial [Actinomycetota bacterium]|nr:hypothetical protein [Actinomycetota bacterium]